MKKTHAIYLLESLLHRLKQEGLPDPDALIRIYTSLAITYVEAGFLRQAADAGEHWIGLPVVRAPEISLWLGLYQALSNTKLGVRISCTGC